MANGMAGIFGNNSKTNYKIQDEENPRIRIDLADDDDYYYLYADVPGKKISDIKMKFKAGDVLSLRIVEESDESDLTFNKNICIKERIHDEVERLIEFDEPINKDNVNARLDNGLLIVEIGKRDPDNDDDEDLIIIKN